MELPAFTKSDFLRIKYTLEPLGFKQTAGLRHYRETTKDELVTPARPRSGREIGFIYTKGDLKVVVWTTWLELEDRPRKKGYDAGRVVIRQRNIGEYYRDIPRRGSFADILIRKARIARCRIRCRPSCSHCGAFMDIVYRRPTGQHWWTCPAGHMTASWDTEQMLSLFPEDVKREICQERKRRKKQAALARKNGKEPRASIKRRRGWKRKELPIGDF